MKNLENMVQTEIESGLSDLNARAKVCQDVVLKAIASGSLNRNITVKGGVVMRCKTGNIRRATQDLDIDFIRYSLSDESIDEFITKMNVLDGIFIKRIGIIEELKQQDYKGKRVRVEISDDTGFKIESKIDLGVHDKLDIAQEEYCFDIAFDENGASLLINSNEQMLVEKLKSLLKFGTFSTRFKDVFDIFYLSRHIDSAKLKLCMSIYIYNDGQMRESNGKDVLKRIQRVFADKTYLKRLASSSKNWLDIPVKDVVDGIMGFLSVLE
ncbi:MAG: nucleotidyl transferase AbiEii/AbiGii toxin family protein [Fibrobacter sp.]|nr:nucleotidyl transferase AbiEii/AbiGii toxin family protein [Fibrobacter sp.]